LRAPERTSIERINAFNEGAVKHCFQKLQTVMEKYNSPEATLMT
jgi:hypothetical protein